ncbi:MFS transporter [Streptomyces sp. NPDC091281]|uniref:MFS transporter n=1 Tax=Streptomyces sp. NPDC091281 TaxID=3365985 RepID=UPI003803E21A
MTTVRPPEAVAEAPRPMSRARYLYLVAAVTWPAQVMAVVGTMSGNAQAAVAQHFRTTHIAWFTVTLFIVTLAITPFAMRLGQIYGKRKVMLVLIAVGLVGDVIAALSPSYGIMLLGRSLAGFYGPVAALVFASVRDLFPKERISGAYTVIGAAMGVATLLSPLVAGLLMDHHGWRSVLWTMAGVTVVSFVCVALIPETPTHGLLAGLDWAGGVLLGAGMAALAIGFGMGGEWGWSSVSVLGCLIGGGVLFALFVVVELRTARPIFDVRILGRRSVSTVLTGPALIVGTSNIAPTVLTFLALFPAIPQVSASLGWSLTHLALVGIPAALAWVAAGLLTGRVLRTVPPRPVWIAGSVTLTAGLVLCALYHRTATEIVLTGIVVAVGTGVIQGTSNAMIVSVVGSEDQAPANGLSGMLGAVIAILGLQLLFIVMSNESRVVNGVAFYQDTAFTHGYYLLAAMAALGVLVSALMPRVARPADALAGEPEGSRP